MKEYTVLSLCFALLTIVGDRLSGVHVLKRKEYYFFILIIFFFKCLINGYLTGKQIVLYRSQFMLGWRLGSIPVEDFIFGFSLVTLTIILFEYFKKRKHCQKN